MLAVVCVGVVWLFSLVNHFSFLSPSLWETSCSNLTYFLSYFSMYYRDFSVKSKLIIPLFQTVKLSLSISLFQKIGCLHIITTLMTSLKAPTSHCYCTRRQAAKAPLRHSFLSGFLRSVSSREISSDFRVANCVYNQYHTQ